MMASASEEVDMEQNSGAMNNDRSQNNWDEKTLVYGNDLIMRQLVSFVSNVEDRKNLELTSDWLRYLSSKVPYISATDSNTILDLNFTMVEPLMSVSIADNHFEMKALTSSTRRSAPELLGTQPESCIIRMRQIIKRFANQIHELHVGGISDFERRLGYIPDHQLVLSQDLCSVFDELDKVETLVLRNLCLMAPVIDYWSTKECALTNRVSKVCFHSIWFDHAEDIDKFVSIVSPSVRLLHLSDCSGKTIKNIVERIRVLGTRLDFVYLAVDHRTFRNVDQARQVFEDVSEITGQLHVCACFSRFVSQPGFRILANVISLLPDVRQITAVEVDLGAVKKNMRPYQRFFAGLSLMPRLRVLRLFGYPINYGCMDLWKQMLCSIGQSSQITELSMVNLLRNIRTEEVQAFCASLPVNLNIFALHHAHHLQDSHFSIIAKRCPRLHTLYLRDLRSVTSEGITKALMEFRMLTKIAVCHSGPIAVQSYELLADRDAMPQIEAAILGGNRDQLSSDVLEVLTRRLPQCRVLGTSNRWRDCEYHLWSRYKSYRELLDASCFADCPGCGKDVSLIDDDDEST